jgi:cysteine-rich repeat protein
MNEAPGRHLLARGVVPGSLAALGCAAILSSVGLGCTNASISSTGGAGGNGKGGGGGGSQGTGGVIVIITPTASSGGTTGGTATTLVCNSTSTSGCKAQIPEGCGDNVNNQGGIEQCDDGNTQSDDGCASDCTAVETGYQCRAAGKPCTPKCGDGILLGDEECEFTTATPPTGCTSNCRVEPGYDCDPTTLVCKPIECGNGTTERGEQCDDGNDLPFDGCYQCRKEPVCSDGKCVSSCGDGQRFADEECDDGILDGSYGGCTAQCKLGPHCGDGIVNGSEECDHGTDNGKDGLCSATCKAIIYAPP